MNCDFGIVIVLYRHRFADIRISMDSSSISAGHNAEADGKCLFCRAWRLERTGGKVADPQAGVASWRGVGADKIGKNWRELELFENWITWKCEIWEFGKECFTWLDLSRDSSRYSREANSTWLWLENRWFSTGSSRYSKGTASDGKGWPPRCDECIAKLEICHTCHPFATHLCQCAKKYQRRQQGLPDEKNSEGRTASPFFFQLEALGYASKL